MMVIKIELIKSFTATFDGSENDVRFIYSAASVSFIINDWSGVNKESACKFLKSCLVNFICFLNFFNFNSSFLKSDI